MSGRRDSVVGSVPGSPRLDASGNPAPKKFLNGWTKEQEQLMAEWSDIAACYRWLHDRAEKKYSKSAMGISIPVIILSTLTGAANFAIGSFIPENDDALKKYVQGALGGVSIFAGILTTLGSYFQFAQKSEANRVAGVSWGKFQRQVAVELAINPNDRIEAMDFLKICRQELDRLIEQSPPIPDSIINQFEREFKDLPTLKKPDICHGIEHTRVYNSNQSRLGKIAADAAMHIRYRKSALTKELIPAVERKIDDAMQYRVQQEIATRVQEEMETKVEERIEERIRTLLPAAAVGIVPPLELGGHAGSSRLSDHGDRDDLATVITHLEGDWRKLLVGRKHILGLAAAPKPVKVVDEIVVDFGTEDAAAAAEADGAEPRPSTVLPIPPPPAPTSTEVSFV